MNARKTCTKCGQTKDVGEFREYRKGGRAYWRGACRECERAGTRRWASDNPDRQKANRKTWRRTRGLEYNRRYRVLKRSLPADGSGEADWLRHHEETDTWHCHLCGGAFRAEDAIHWDHRDPVSTGTAGHVIANVSAAHEACNLSRQNVPLDEWHARLGLPDGIV